jgi:hypothetical protein
MQIMGWARTLIMVGIACLSAHVGAQSTDGVPALEGTSYRVVQATVDSGGGQAEGGQYVVRGTIGQHDASQSSCHAYELRGGFWAMPGTLDDGLFNDRFEVIVPRLGQF